MVLAIAASTPFVNRCTDFLSGKNEKLNKVASLILSNFGILRMRNIRHYSSVPLVQQIKGWWAGMERGLRKAAARKPRCWHMVFLAAAAGWKMRLGVWHSGGGPAAFFTWLGVGFKSCLLYTSDAADE